jgi:hypothetical protein
LTIERVERWTETVVGQSHHYAEKVVPDGLLRRVPAAIGLSG